MKIRHFQFGKNSFIHIHPTHHGIHPHVDDAVVSFLGQVSLHNNKNNRPFVLDIMKKFHTHTHTQAITTNDHCDVVNGGGRFNIDGKWIITFIALDSLNMWRYNDCIDNIVWSLSFAHFSISSSSSLSFWFILAHTYNGQWSCANDFSMVHHHHQSNIISNEYRMLMFSSWLWRWWMMIVKWNKYSNRATN